MDTLEDIFYHGSRRKQAEAKNATKEESQPQTTAAQEEISIEESSEEKYTKHADLETRRKQQSSKFQRNRDEELFQIRWIQTCTQHLE